MKNIPFCLFVFLLLLTGKGVKAQSPEKECYDILTAKGDSCLRLTETAVDNYRKAIEFYNAAKDCEALDMEKTLDGKIQGALARWVEELDSAREQAVTKAEEAEKQKYAAFKQKERADSLAVKAQRNACSSEANRLALIADIERQDGRDSAALYLAYRALQLDSTSPQILRTFRQAVFNFYDKPLLEGKENCTDFQYIPSTGKMLLVYPDALIVLDSHDRLSSTNWTVPLNRPVEGAVLSPSGGQLLAFRKDSALVWESGSEKAISSFRHEERILNAAFSASGDTILTCSRDNSARLWSLSGKLLKMLSRHEGNIYEGRFSTDGALLLTRSSDGTVGIWNNQGGLEARLPGHDLFIYEARFSTDGEAVLTAGADSTVRIWTPEGELKHTFKNFGNAVTTALFHPSGDTILTGTAGGSLELRDSRGRFIRAFNGHADKITGASFSPDGRLLLTTSRDGFSRLWRTGGELLMVLNLEKSEPPPSVFSRDGRSMIAARGSEGALCCPLPGVLLAEWSTRKLFTPEEKKTYQENFDVKDLNCNIKPGAPAQK